MWTRIRSKIERPLIVQVSNFGATQLGYDVVALRGQQLSSLYPSDQQAQVVQHLADLSRHEADAVMVWEAQMVNFAGERLWVRHSGRRLDPDSTTASCILVCEDVTALLELTDKLEHEATHDPLTGLVNRREFDRRLRTLISVDAEGIAGSVCYIDVDQFKIVNDTAGHHAGDALLVFLAETLAGLLQQRDVLARLGGDEFAVLLPGCSLADAVRVAERLRVAASDSAFTWSDKTFGVSLSIGIAAIDPTRPGTDDVMGRADAACYDAKHDGRNRVSIAASRVPTDRSSSSDGEWGNRLRDALMHDDLQVVSQQIVAVDTADRYRRAELLVRLRGADGELLAAGPTPCYPIWTFWP